MELLYSVVLVSAVQQNESVIHIHIAVVHCLVAKSCPTLWPPGLKHTRLPSPSPSPGACSNSCPLIRWCHPTISSSAAPFSFCLQSFLTLGSFPVSWVFMTGGQKIGVSASSISPSHEYSGLMSFRIFRSLCCPKDSQESSPASQYESINSLALSLLYGPTLASIRDY